MTSAIPGAMRYQMSTCNLITRITKWTLLSRSITIINIANQIGGLC